MIRMRTTRGASQCTAAALPVAAGSLCLLFAAPASAATLGGTATIALPGGEASAPMDSGGSTTQFTVVLPANAACSGDTADEGYHVYSYLVRSDTILSGVTFISVPSTGYGLVDSTGTYYGAINTAIKAGQIIGIPSDFEWGPLVTNDGGSVPLSHLLYRGSSGVWEAGIACANTKGGLIGYWNTQVTFLASAQDAHGFVWSAAPGAPISAVSAAPGRTGVPNGVSSTTATSLAAATTTTIAGEAVGSRSDRGSSASPDGATRSPDDGTSGGSPASTDLPVAVAVCAGLLAAGVGLLLLRRGARKPVGAARVTRSAAR